jgi:hypothetical protein
MADIFVSYAREDKALVTPPVAALEQAGWSVWWHPSIATGQEFDELMRAPYTPSTWMPGKQLRLAARSRT